MHIFSVLLRPLCFCNHIIPLSMRESYSFLRSVQNYPRLKQSLTLALQESENIYKLGYWLRISYWQHWYVPSMSY